ncbi:MAG: hypothetical protein AAF593_08050 [Planctomycetota bacterium]
MSKRKLISIWGTVSVLLVGAIYLLIRVVTSFTGWISSLESDLAAAIIAASATVLAGFGAVILSQQRTKIREINESHRPKKIELYSRFVSMVMDAMHKYKDNPEADIAEDAEVLEFFKEFTSDLVLWGSASVIQEYEKFRRASRSGEGLNIVLLMDQVIRAMRKDIGHSDWTLKSGDIVKAFLSDPSELDSAVGN